MKEKIPNYLKDKLLSTTQAFTKQDMEQLGLSWPPVKGWKRKALRRLELEAEYTRRIEKEKSERKAKKRAEKLAAKQVKRTIKFYGETGLKDGFIVRRTGTGKAHILVNGRTLCRRGVTDRTVAVSKAPGVPLCSTCLKLKETDPQNERIVGSEEKGFYFSWEWKKARFETLKRYGAICMCCGSTERIVVDHIKPRSRYPELELDLNNLQVLCNDCNMGKSNDDTTDFRPHSKERTPQEYAELKLIYSAIERGKPNAN